MKSPDSVRLKKRLRDMIEQFIYHKVDERKKAFIDEMVTRHSMVTNGQEGFVYNGKKYYHSAYSSIVRFPYALHMGLRADMQAFLDEYEQIDDYERPLVIGYVQTVLNMSDDPQVYLRMLPSALVEPLRDVIATLPGGFHELSLDDAEKLVETHRKSFDLLKQRLVFNLLE